jgi:vanillate O-demethylase ferredoxin subunit
MTAAEPIPVVVTSAKLIARDVREVQLAHREGGPLPAFAPGSHIDLHLAPGLTRQYSLCGELEDAMAYTIAVKLEEASRGGSKAVHQTLSAGSRLTISQPRNNFPLDVDAPHTVLIAGGIGITPLLSMARALARRGNRFTLHYFARSEEHAAYAAWLQASAISGQCHFHFGLASDQSGEVLQRALDSRPHGAQVYLCGPRGFMDRARSVATTHGWPDDSVHLEYFNAGSSILAADGSAIRVALARTGISVPVPAGVPIIDALRAAGVSVETSCEQGVCGTCVTRVLGGVPEHHDLFLTDAEKARGDCMAICVSRSLTDELVLDL